MLNETPKQSFKTFALLTTIPSSAYWCVHFKGLLICPSSTCRFGNGLFPLPPFLRRKTTVVWPSSCALPPGRERERGSAVCAIAFALGIIRTSVRWSVHSIPVSRWKHLTTIIHLSLPNEKGPFSHPAAAAVCVCVWRRERERKRWGGLFRFSNQRYIRIGHEMKTAALTHA